MLADGASMSAMNARAPRRSPSSLLKPRAVRVRPALRQGLEQERVDCVLAVVVQDGVDARFRGRLGYGEPNAAAEVPASGCRPAQYQGSADLDEADAGVLCELGG